METFRKEMDENGKRAIDGIQMKLDYMWDQLRIKVNYLLFHNILVLLMKFFKGKMLANPKGIAWSGLKTKASISEFGLKATVVGYQFVFTTEGFATTGDHCRKDNFPFPGTILFYYEVTATGW
jgi:hypothetical protein